MRRIWWAVPVLGLALIATACTSGATDESNDDTASVADDDGGDDTGGGDADNASGCGGITAGSSGLQAGAFPGQWDLSEFEQLSGCTLTFSENPNIDEHAARISHIDGELPPVDERLPAEPLVVAPYDTIGTYGGRLRMTSNAAEAGSSDVLSVRSVGLVRYSDDLKTIVPDVAQSYTWNDDYTQLTFTLREGHRWSDGEPFTSEDVAFWYDDLILNEEINPQVPSVWLFGGEPLQLEVIDDLAFTFTASEPSPQLLNFLAATYIQPFQPAHFLGQFHIDHNPDASELAEERGFESWAELLRNYYNDWKDVPSPLLDGSDTVVSPTLESHILVQETAEGRLYAANPYYHVVDTAGNQLPYIDEVDEQYIIDPEIVTLKINNGEIDYKTQGLTLTDFPTFKENEEAGNFTTYLPPATANQWYGFNMASKDAGLAEIFSDLRFRQAMSLAVDRDEVNELAFLGQGGPEQFTYFDPNDADFVTEEQLSAFTEYDPDGANALLDEMGLERGDDGFRRRADGSDLVIQLQYSPAFGPPQAHEIVRDHWADIGIRVNLKEVTTDEYRQMAANNELDVTMHNERRTATYTLNNLGELIPPFGIPGVPGPGNHWGEWYESEGASGTEPPAHVKELVALAYEWRAIPLGTDESDELGRQMSQIWSENIWKVGTVGSTSKPVVATNRLSNFRPLKLHTYDYYWIQPYRPFQWTFTDS